MTTGIRASEVFDFLQSHSTNTIERYELRDARLNVVRRALRLIATELQDGGDQAAIEVSLLIRRQLMELLTTPVEFKFSLEPVLDILQLPSDASIKWGTSVGTWYAEAIGYTQDLLGEENPMRQEMALKLATLGNTAFRICCHRSARRHFESLFDMVGQRSLLQPDPFIHSVRDYRESPLFDLLIKAGPLRSRGWGSAPDALLNAPRFNTLFQIVWAGCSDENDFGYDPALSSVASAKSNNTSSLKHKVNWTKVDHPIVTQSPEMTISAEEVDEFVLFRELDRDRIRGFRRAVAVQIDDDTGILYPPHSEVMVFDPHAHDESRLGVRLAGETLKPGMYLLLPYLDDIGLGESRAKEGDYSAIWKQKLVEKLTINDRVLEQNLRNSGIKLKSLHSCMHHWARPSSTVIHAPQLRKHFEILIKTLGLNSVETRKNGVQVHWWHSAWTEIAKARGVAIQTGMEGQDLIDESLLSILQNMMSMIAAKAREGESFDIDIPEGLSLTGSVEFYKVIAIEEGFRAPDIELKSVADLNSLEQWRD